MKITSKGQVTIHVEIREKLGFLPNTDVEFEVVGDALYLKKIAILRGSRFAIAANPGKQLIAAMQGKATVKMTTEEIMQLTRQDA
ncbi:AbrB/MazE/SpoVT family DNA-binding domain-containing protein [Brunnivagina elsteri]|uniref:AbrB family transcriptional regulator n=1 Tax=Brunnivagina elsteri CCALA 953 TaxID=987040 RepID=A0A2A2TJ28_9CYAN|nr:AbrB/MazE/SpoVT family DNA-binding domain-containing protein [Calothrix elsteri]PAX54333.1 AbrB family transcriptional regulator [Calothrix elsteri CCALA 953]